MAIKADCIITLSTEGKGAYGVRTDNDENVYFPKALAAAAELVEFDLVRAVLIPNPDCPHNRNPWRAVFVRQNEETD